MTLDSLERLKQIGFALGFLESWKENDGQTAANYIYNIVYITEVFIKALFGYSCALLAICLLSAPLLRV